MAKVISRGTRTHVRFLTTGLWVGSGDNEDKDGEVLLSSSSSFIARFLPLEILHVRDYYCKARIEESTLLILNRPLWTNYMVCKM